MNVILLIILVISTSTICANNLIKKTKNIINEDNSLNFTTIKKSKCDPIPVITATYCNVQCSGIYTNIIVSSNIPGTILNYTYTTNGVSIVGGTCYCMPITDLLDGQGTITYTIYSSYNGCSGIPYEAVITVNKVPTMIIMPSSQTICNCANTNITMVSDVFPTNYSWTVNQINVAGGLSGNGSTINQTLCNTSIVDGTAYYFITPISNYCTGISQGITVTVKNNVLNNETIEICQGQNYTIGLHNYSASGIYYDTLTTFGCDSIIVTNLTVNPSYSSNNSITLCQGENYIFNGHIYNTTGTYYDTLYTSLGCDSIVITNLTILIIPEITATPSSLQLCSGDTALIVLGTSVSNTIFNWSVYAPFITGAFAGSGDTIQQILTTTGSLTRTAVYTITPSSGACVGTLLNILVIVSPKPNVELGPLDSLCTPSTGFSIVLDAGNAGSTYLWSTGDTTQQVQIWGDQLHYPGLDSVWVIVSKGNCTVFDTKYFWLDICEGIDHFKNEIIYKIYPNPTKNFLTIEGIINSQVVFINSQGKIIKKMTLSNPKIIIDLKEFIEGIYIIKIDTNKEYFIKKFIKIK